MPNGTNPNHPAGSCTAFFVTGLAAKGYVARQSPLVEDAKKESYRRRETLATRYTPGCHSRLLGSRFGSQRESRVGQTSRA
jgi:hypothetical protein